MSLISRVRSVEVSVTVEFEDGSRRLLGDWCSSDASLAVNNVKIEESTFFEVDTSRIKKDNQRTLVTVSWSEE